MRGLALTTCLVLTVVGCGGGELTLTEYAEQVEGLTTTMYATIDDLTAELEAKVQTPASLTAEYLDTAYGGMATAFRELRNGLEAIDAPQDLAEMHDVSVEIMTRLTAASEAFARRARAVESEDQMRQLWDSPEARALEAAQFEIVEFCQSRQTELDATAEREGFAEVPWIPPEMQEVVRVAFGCDNP